MTLTAVIKKDVFAHLCDSGNFSMQFIGSVVNAVILFLTTYIFGDASFLAAIGVLIAWDVVTGAWASMKHGDFQFTLLFRKTIEKIILYFIFMSAFWIAMNIEVESTGSRPLSWLDWVGYSWLAANEVSSIVKNIARIKPGFLPKWLVNRFKQFDKTGKFE